MTLEIILACVLGFLTPLYIITIRNKDKVIEKLQDEIMSQVKQKQLLSEEIFNLQDKIGILNNKYEEFHAAIDPFAIEESSDMNIEFRGKDRHDKWHHGFLDYRDTSLQIHVVEDIPPTMQDPCGDLYSKYFTVIPETLGMYANFKIKNDRKIYTDDVVFREIEEDEGDVRIYLIATFVKEWNMFAWLMVEEYNDYKNNGIEFLDETLFWTYNIGKDKYSNFTYAGNIHDNPELLTK